MSVASKTKNASTVRNALLTTAMATGGALLLAGGTQAQGQAATPPPGFTPLSDIGGVSRVEVGADGAMQLVMSDGRTVLIAATDVAVVDGIYFVSEAAIEANALLGVSTAAAAGGGGGAILGALGGLGLLGAAAGGGGGGGGSSPTPTPTPTPTPNTNPPVFSSATTAAVDENSTGTIYTATATDADGNTITFSISGGDDASLFSINSSTGAVTFNAPPDYEAPADSGGDNDYVITIRASDGTNTTDQTVTISVGDVDEAPTITSAATVSVDENTAGTVYTAEATDPEGGAVTYSLTGTDAALFTIDAATGAVSFIALPNYEAPADGNGDNVYDIIVNASDGTNTATQAVAVSVTNLNEFAPVFTSASTDAVDEGTTASFYTATATDADGDALTYSITGGADQALFQIDAATGELSFITAPDFENPTDANSDNVYEIALQVADGTLSDTQNVTITVTNVDEAGGPVFSSASSQTVSENQSSAYVARATDPQADTVSYSISGADAALFTIDASSGEVSFRTAPDFEAPGDAGGNNVYDIIVSASDGTDSNSQAVSITVADVTSESADVPENDTTQISMVSGGDYTGQIEVAGDRDWVAITLEAGQRYQFDAFGSGGTGVELTDTYIRLYDASGTLIAENDEITLGVNTDSRLGFTATTSGTYYVSVGAWEPDSGATLSGQYTLQVRHTDPLTAWNYQEIGDYLNANGSGGQQWDRSAGDTITVNITDLTVGGQTLARAALQLWEDITGINFTEVATGGDITFDDDEEGAFASTTFSGFITSASINVSTAWITTYGTNIDGYSFQTYIHEIGHALGLGHGGPYNTTADYAVDAIYLNDSWQASVMSYFSQNENTFINADYGYVIGPQVADIIAVLDMYGGSTSTRDGDTTYGFNSTAGNVIFDATAHSNPVSFTIFDTGGTDTMDYSGSAADQTLDLREQAYSSVLGRDGNVGIARGTVIENAIGGSGDDIFIGNDANNVLTGAGGADRFYASGGTDVFSGGSGSDTAVFSGASTDYTLSTNGSGNTVVTDNRAGAPDGVVELISVENIVYDGGTSNPEYFGDPNFAGREGLDPNDMPPTETVDPDALGHGQGCPCAGCHTGHGDGEKEGQHDHVYPHLSDGDLALLLNLSDTIGDFRGEVGTNIWRNGEDARGDIRDALLEWPVELEGAIQADKGHPVFETLTVPSAADAPVSQVAGASAYGPEFFPADAFTDAFDARDAQMLTLSDDASDGWA